jgi:hypothetical protein
VSSPYLSQLVTQFDLPLLTLLTLHLQFFLPNISFFIEYLSLELFPHHCLLILDFDCRPTRSPVPSLSQYDASLCISGTRLLRASNIVHLVSINFSRPFISSWAGVITILIPVLLTAEISWINLTYSSKFVCANIPLFSATAFD